MKFVLSILFAICVAGSVTGVGGTVGFSRGDTAATAYPFSCSWDSLTADFADRDALPQTQDPPGRWYSKNAEGDYPNAGWGPRANALPAPDIPLNAGCDPSVWKQERILAVAMRYIYLPGNPLGLQYRHHHIPDWDPPTSTYAGVSEDNPDPDAPRGPAAWGAGRGLDCSNFTAWVYNYGLGIKFSGDVHQQFDGTAGPMGLRVGRDGPFRSGDLIYLHPNGNTGHASHVVIYIDDQRIIDSRLDAQNVPGVQIRNRLGWYREAVLGAWRPIG
ncbi:NlpC/P60 family protein [Mycobacterium shigaense]|uniref:Uncharacterized protein n=1 Tax=Mycobacterium shigaense TaxID=722731 RepID=A0A1Z4EIY3_9MYCO|nr:NlpC/P60 family protein [Mycobacterium shigaense]MEA1124068.1 NlpC/P60 family protein [Mycobacterium shigaense]PRI13777.1 hypothetical protein B2J96_19210 [Mycobacterium shigaense]BAX92917.1 hypothetical protein MSG_02773 [Mycobacterium shigaense]